MEPARDDRDEFKKSRNRSEWCSVPGCHKNKRRHPDLHFHLHFFSADAESRKKWVAAIRRDEGPLFKASIYQCMRKSVL